MPRDKTILRKRAVPKNVTPPNGWTFYAMYEWIGRNNPPWNARVVQRGTIYLYKNKEGAEWLVTC